MVEPPPPEDSLRASLEELGLADHEISGLGIGLSPSVSPTARSAPQESLLSCLSDILREPQSTVDLEDLIEVNESIFCMGVQAEPDVQELLHQMVQKAAELYLNRPEDMMSDGDRYHAFGCELLVLLGNVQAQPCCTAEQRTQLLWWMSEVSRRSAEIKQGGIDHRQLLRAPTRETNRCSTPSSRRLKFRSTVSVEEGSHLTGLRHRVVRLQQDHASLEEENGALRQLIKVAGSPVRTGSWEGGEGISELQELQHENEELKEEREKLLGVLKLMKMKMASIHEVVFEFNPRDLDAI
mmetsp:Transcript_93285/g.213244  ORF Transcript_93285/g.213244 Transcript_93285/m.213244 type:complete len:296 (-) Transcript_93285:149-1036(-)